MGQGNTLCKPRPRRRNRAADSGAAGEGGKEMKYIIELEKIEGTDLYRAKGADTFRFPMRWAIWS